MFRDYSKKCNCDFRLSKMMMCRYENYKLKNFDIYHFDIQHHCKKESTMSEAINEDLDHTNTRSIVNNTLTSAEKCEQ